MSYDVVVVGGGVGGLTVAALLSARGFNVCLLERQSQVGGCIGRIGFGGYDFEPGMGLHTSWGPGEIYDRVFSELPVEAPETRLIDSDYLVRFENSTDIPLRKTDGEFFDELRKAFPECSESAVEFYKLVSDLSQKWKSEAPEQRHGFLGRALRGFQSVSRVDGVKEATRRTALSYASNTSPRFQRFVDAQLNAFLQTSISRCAFLPACLALMVPRTNLYSIYGGTATIAERLVESIKKSGGTIRLNSPVLRLAYNESGDAVGVDLLTGETVVAKRAIISNLTIWDTYGRLVGLHRTPAEIKSQLQENQSRGVYLICATVDETARQRLPAQNFLVAKSQTGSDIESISDEFTFTMGQPAVDGKTPTTIKTSSEVLPWFAFQTSEEDYEERDQEALERFWTEIHRLLPELGSGIEVIETANPRTYYDQTRRKLGMVMGVEEIPARLNAGGQPSTSIPNLFMVGDTVSSQGFGTPSVVSSSLALANQLSK